MKIIRYVLLGIICLSPLGPIAMAKEELGLAEEGTVEAEELKKAHEADLEGAMEEPEEAERRTQWLHEEEGEEEEPSPTSAPEEEPTTAPE